MKADAVKRQRAVMRQHGWDAMIAISPENYAFTAGYIVPTQPLLRWRHALSVVPAKGDPALICVDMEETTVRGRSPDAELRTWAEFGGNAMQTLAGLLSDMGCAEGTVGIEFNYLPAADYLDLCKRLPKATIADSAPVFDELRMIKTPDEIELLRRLSRLADKGIADAYGSVRAGSTEMDIARALIGNIYAAGAENFTLLIVATGERSQLPNVGPTERKLQAQDICRVEIFPIIGGYHAGICRTAAVKAPPPEAERIWANLTECKHLILDMIKPGASTRAIYEAYLAKFGELGLPPIDFVGHGIGLHLHEEPYLGKFGDGPLEAGMVLGIEPLCYRTGFGFGMQNKDLVLVTETGSELLSDVTDTDTPITVE